MRFVAGVRTEAYGEVIDEVFKVADELLGFFAAHFIPLPLSHRHRHLRLQARSLPTSHTHGG